MILAVREDHPGAGTYLRKFPRQVVLSVEPFLVYRALAHLSHVVVVHVAAIAGVVPVLTEHQFAGLALFLQFEEQVARLHAYPGRRGRMHFTQEPAELKELENAHHLVFRNSQRTSLYAFSNESFRLLEFEADGNMVRFSDDTGVYELDYNLHFYNDDDLVPVGTKGFGKNDLTKYIESRLVKRT